MSRSSARFRHRLPTIRGISDLTPRQREVLDGRCLAGLTNAEIGSELGVALQTVKNHIADIRLRLGRPSMNQICYRYGQEHQVEAQRPEQV